MILPSLSSSATFDLPPTRYSIGSGMDNSIRQLGSVFGIAFAVLCVGSESAHAATGFTALYSGLTAAALITALLGASVRTDPMKVRSPSLAGAQELPLRVSGHSHICSGSALIEIPSSNRPTITRVIKSS